MRSPGRISLRTTSSPTCRRRRRGGADPRKLLTDFSDEVPHGIAVGIESMKEREDKELIDIEATIYCEKDSHKGIIIGKKGAMLIKIGIEAREELERFLACKVNLQLWVKVKEDWRNREGLLRNFGFTEK